MAGLRIGSTEMPQGRFNSALARVAPPDLKGVSTFDMASIWPFRPTSIETIGHVFARLAHRQPRHVRPRNLAMIETGDKTMHVNKPADAAMAAVATQAGDRIAAANREIVLDFLEKAINQADFEEPPDPFRSTLCPAQSDDRRRRGRYSQAHGRASRTISAVARRGKADRRRRRSRCRACSCHADARRSRSCHRRHLPPGGRQDRRALGGAAARPGDGSARQRVFYWKRHDACRINLEVSGETRKDNSPTGPLAIILCSHNRARRKNSIYITLAPRGGTGENAASIVSFVGEFSAHLLLEIFRTFTRSSIFAHGTSHRGEDPRTAIRFLRCDTQLDEVTSQERGYHR